MLTIHARQLLNVHREHDQLKGPLLVELLKTYKALRSFEKYLKEKYPRPLDIFEGIAFPDEMEELEGIVSSKIEHYLPPEMLNDSKRKSQDASRANSRAIGDEEGELGDDLDNVKVLNFSDLFGDSDNVPTIELEGFLDDDEDEVTADRNKERSESEGTDRETSWALGRRDSDRPLRASEREGTERHSEKFKLDTTTNVSIGAGKPWALPNSEWQQTVYETLLLSTMLSGVRMDVEETDALQTLRVQLGFSRRAEIVSNCLSVFPLSFLGSR